MQQNAFNYDLKRNMISMLLTAIVAAVVTIFLASALINSKLVPAATAPGQHNSTAASVTPAATTVATTGCSTPATSAGGGSGVPATSMPFMNTVMNTERYTHTSSNTSSTTTSTANHNNGNLVSVSDNHILDNVLNNNNILNGNNVGVSALNDVADVTGDNVNATLSNLVTATTAATTGVVGAIGL